MRINPCHGCPIREGCELREDFRRRVSGIGASSVSFRCPRLPEMLAPGTRVTMSMPVEHHFRSRWADEPCAPEDTFVIEHTACPGTVLTITDRGRVQVVMDANDGFDDKYRWRRVRPVSCIITVLDEPRRAICRNGNPIMPDGQCDRRETDQWGAPALCRCDEQAQWQEYATT